MSDREIAQDSPTFITCGSCGFNLPADAQYCGYDGTKLSVSNSSITASARLVKKRCPECSKDYAGYAKFCGNDGADLYSVPLYKTATVSESPVERITAHDTTTSAGVVRPTRSLAGTTLDNKYAITGILAEGGMAVLYLAHHKTMEREVVIKVIHGALAANASAIERFHQECLLAAKLNHPNIVSVYDVGFINGNEPYLVMERIQGQSLAAVLDNKGAASYSVASKILMQTCLGLSEAHNAGIIHRDLKTDNILLQHNYQRPDWVKIVDFGIAHLSQSSKRFTRAGRVLGTPEYMAPEQFRDTPLDIRLDIYALGVLLFEMLTGKPPFESEAPEALMMKHLLEEPPHLTDVRKDSPVAASFDQIIQKAMKKNPDQRFQSALEMHVAIEAAYKEIFSNGQPYR